MIDPGPPLPTVIFNKSWAFVAVGFVAFLRAHEVPWTAAVCFALLPLIAYQDGRRDGKRHTWNHCVEPIRKKLYAEQRKRDRS